VLPQQVKANTKGALNRCGKAFDKTSHHFMIKNVSQLQVRLKWWNACFEIAKL
jgi:hypothetical protein